MDVEAISQAVAAKLDGITGLRGYPNMPMSVSPPVAAPVDLNITYGLTFGGVGTSLSELVFTVLVLTSIGDTDAGRKALLGYVGSGAGSVVAALEADQTLGGTAKTVVVEQATGMYQLHSVAEIQYLGAEFTVRVTAI